MLMVSAMEIVCIQVNLLKKFCLGHAVKMLHAILLESSTVFVSLFCVSMFLLLLLLLNHFLFIDSDSVICMHFTY